MDLSDIISTDIVINYGYHYQSLPNALQRIYYNSKNSAAYRLNRGRIEAGEHNITLSELHEIYNNQNGLCYYTCIPMNFDKNEWRISIERKDTTKGYIKSNVCFTCIEFNGRVQWYEEKFLEFIDIVNKNYIENPIKFEQTNPRKQYRKFNKKIIDNIECHNCTYCNTFKPAIEFNNNLRACKICYKEHVKKYLETPKGAIQKLFNTARTSTKVRNNKKKLIRNLEFDITIEYLHDIYKEQKGLCSYSGIPLQFGSYLDKNWTISLERIDARKGYVKGNVCFICLEFNSADHSVKFKYDCFGNGGWSLLKVQMLIAYIKYKYNQITYDELDAVISIQKQTLSRKDVKQVYVKRNYISNYVSTAITQAKKTYGQIYLITSPSGKQYIEATDILFQGNHAILHNIKRNSKQMINEINEYQEENMKIEKLLTCKKDYLEHYQEIYIKEYNTLYPDGLNYPKIHSSYTKNKIANTLIERNIRFGHDGRELPKYIKYIDWTDRKGYGIFSHPKCKKKDFTNKKKTLEELYQQAIDHLKTLEEAN